MILGAVLLASAAVAAATPPPTVSCASAAGARNHCPADTYILGMNYYPFKTRNHRWNVQVNDVNHSPVSSTFGYYVGGHDGTVVSTAFSIFF
jgi:hypothetical protein